MALNDSRNMQECCLCIEKCNLVIRLVTITSNFIFSNFEYTRQNYYWTIVLMLTISLDVNLISRVADINQTVSLRHVVAKLYSNLLKHIHGWTGPLQGIRELDTKEQHEKCTKMCFQYELSSSSCILNTLPLSAVLLMKLQPSSQTPPSPVCRQFILLRPRTKKQLENVSFYPVDIKNHTHTFSYSSCSRFILKLNSFECFV